MKPTQFPMHLCLITLAAHLVNVGVKAAGDSPFSDAIAVWQMGGTKDASGRNELKIVGAATLGVKLEGKELEESLASGNDGLVARIGQPIRPAGGKPVTRTFTADKRYLLFPCTRGRSGQNKVFITVDGQPYMSAYDALIASSDPDHWRWLDLKLMQGQTLSVKIEGPNAAGIELVKTSDTIPGKCPNLFQLPVDGNQADVRWVTWGSSTEYRIGKFDGRVFVPEGNRKYRAHFGEQSASQVFANAPGGRIVQIAWAHVCDYDGEFSQMASFPLELSLRTTPDGVRLYAEQFSQLEAYPLRPIH